MHVVPRQREKTERKKSEEEQEEEKKQRTFALSNQKHEKNIVTPSLTNKNAVHPTWSGSKRSEGPTFPVPRSGG